MPNYDYDLIVIGGGVAGMAAAKYAQRMGKKVAIIERERFGGECTWTGCIPSKSLIKSAHIAHAIKTAHSFGIKNTTDIDTANVMEHVRKVVKQVYALHMPEQLEKLGITVLNGHAVFLDPHHLQLDHKKIRFCKAIIATGSSPSIPDIKGIDSVAYLTNKTLFDLTSLPKSMIILGGGSVGVELASAFNRLGVSITLVQRNERILPLEDYELSAMLANIMENEGVVIKTNMAVDSIAPASHGIKITMHDLSRKEHEYAAQALLVATGRKPNVHELGLENAGIHFDNQGIKVDEYLRTTSAHIFACGDVVGPYRFSHMAWYQAMTATRNALSPLFKQKVDYTNKMWVTFSAPEFSSIGLTEQEAREQYGDSVAVYRSSYAELDRAYTDGVTAGMAKFVIDKKGYILGAQILGAHAGEIIGQLQVAKVNGLKFVDLYKGLHAYPVLSELIWQAAKKAYKARLQKQFFIRWAYKIMGDFN